jgi:uncharacterized protein with GYD domain
MNTYIVLWNFTDEGARNIKHTAQRGEVFKAQAAQLGVNVKDYYWTLGNHDGVIILEAPDDETVARLIFQARSFGTLHAQVLRAFAQDQMDRILS